MAAGTDCIMQIAYVDVGACELLAEDLLPGFDAHLELVPRQATLACLIVSAWRMTLLSSGRWCGGSAR
jgi:hypothetical protein